MKTNDVIVMLGGANEIASRLGVTHWAVRKWSLHGIPAKHIFTLARFAKERGFFDLTPEALAEINAKT